MAAVMGVGCRGGEGMGGRRAEGGGRRERRRLCDGHGGRGGDGGAGGAASNGARLREAVRTRPRVRPACYRRHHHGGSEGEARDTVGYEYMRLRTGTARRLGVAADIAGYRTVTDYNKGLIIYGLTWTSRIRRDRPTRSTRLMAGRRGLGFAQ
ncbi:hypothetical protein DFH27DRAFT_58623 [Peziza echinospora]|nr:hypothetical protein DFH27DRAFT_58623 [Peziza echinospora]